MELAANRVHAVLETISAKADRLHSHVAHYELKATRLVERCEKAHHEATRWLHTHAGRMRTKVDGLLDMRAGRTSLVSQQETRVDGKQVLLG